MDKEARGDRVPAWSRGRETAGHVHAERMALVSNRSATLQCNPTSKQGLERVQACILVFSLPFKAPATCSVKLVAKRTCRVVLKINKEIVPSYK